MLTFILICDTMEQTAAILPAEPLPPPLCGNVDGNGYQEAWAEYRDKVAPRTGNVD